MTAPSRSSSDSGTWIRMITTLAGVVVLVGMFGADSVEVFGLGLPPTLVGAVLYLLGFGTGYFSTRRV